MGGGASRREPEVHVVVVQSQENGKMDAKVLRQAYVQTRAQEGQDGEKGMCDIRLSLINTNSIYKSTL